VGPGLSKTARQFGRYALVGAIAFVVDFGVLFGVTSLAGLHYLIGAAAGFMAGVSVNYLLSVRWVFDTRRVQRAAVEFQVFATIGVLGLAINEGLMWVLTDGLDLYYLLSKILAASVLLLWNFFVRRYFLFS
jgi:putative flippase GtrA